MGEKKLLSSWGFLQILGALPVLFPQPLAADQLSYLLLPNFSILPIPRYLELPARNYTLC